MSIANLVLRAVPGAFILNSGIGKLGMDEATAEYLHGAAAKGVPAIAEMSPKQFGQFLTYGEIAVGTALLAPFVPTRVAGLALGTFASGLLASYFRTPEMTEADGVRPSQDGIALAKDSWLAAIAAALVLGGKK